MRPLDQCMRACCQGCALPADGEAHCARCSHLRPASAHKAVSLLTHALLQGFDSGGTRHLFGLVVELSAILCQVALVIVFVACVMRSYTLPDVLRRDYALYEDATAPARMLLPKRVLPTAEVQAASSAAAVRYYADRAVEDLAWCSSEGGLATAAVPERIPAWTQPEDPTGMNDFMAAQVRPTLTAALSETCAGSLWTQHCMHALYNR